MRSAASRALVASENSLASLTLLAMVLLPILEVAVRQVTPGGIPGSTMIVQHLTLWVAFMGAAIAAREGKLLALATATFLPAGSSRRVTEVLAGGFAAAIGGLLTFGAIDLIVVNYAFPDTIGAGIPKWFAQLVMPVGLAAITVRVIWRASPGWVGRSLAALGLVFAVYIWYRPDVLWDGSAWPVIAAIVVAAILGAPIFVLLGGAAVLLNLLDAEALLAPLIDAYDLTTDETLPAIPLFTLAGFILAEGKSSERLLDVFRAWFGWVPGGTAVVCALVCSFFTVFTGGSGVTILALGGLLLPALLKEGYRERFSLGLLTASGSLGLLLPPALPLILYAIVAQVPMENMFIGGIVPGILLTSLVASWGVREGLVAGVKRQAFDSGAALSAVWRGKWELAMPLVVLGSMFLLGATAVQASAFTAFYALTVQVVIHRELSITGDLLRVFTECLTIVGGVLIILAVAVGLTSYLVLNQIPSQLLDWTQQHVESRLMFLLILNVFLLGVGAFMDIFSATVVIVPLLVGFAEAYDINAVHLGIIFIANLELGYLTPPVGLNLFLSSYRFKKPVLEVARASLPMLVILTIGVLLITYVDVLTTGLLSWMGRL